jgi:nucleotide-binding universal stress UspA family protein
MLTNLLVPIDGSHMSLKAAEVALEIARQHDSRVTLIHVARRFNVPDAVRAYLRDEHLEGEPLYDIDAATRRVIEDIHREAGDAGLEKIETVFREGRPARSIVDYADHHRIGAIVMGARGLGDPEGDLLGSVSHKVASLAHCTVIMVR